MTACSFAVSAHVCWNWAARAARTAIPLFILGPTLSTCRSLDMRRLESIRRPCRGFCVTTRRVTSKDSSQQIWQLQGKGLGESTDRDRARNLLIVVPQLVPSCPFYIPDTSGRKSAVLLEHLLPEIQHTFGTLFPACCHVFAE